MARRGAFYHGLLPPVPTGGPSYVMGPVQNAFAGASRAAAENARDTYAGAQAAWRQRYVSNLTAVPRFAIRLDVTGGQRIYQVLASVAGNALTWADIPSLAVVEGEKGAKGDPGAGATKAEIYTQSKDILRQANDILVTPSDPDETITIGRKSGSATFTRRAGWSPDAAVSEAEVLAGASSTTQRITIPAPTGAVQTAGGGRLFFWLEGNVDLQRIQIGALSILGEFARSTLVVDGDSGTLYTSRNALTSRMAGSVAILV